MKLTLPIEGDNLPSPPSKADGGLWPFVLIHDGGVTFADTNSELVGELIEGYDALDFSTEGNDRAVEMRYASAVATSTLLQTAACVKATEDGLFDPASVTEDELNALFVERTTPFEGTTTPGGSLSLDWKLDVPLVLIDLDYAPFATRERPTGNVAWLSPSVETTYLFSLDEAGLVSYLRAEAASVSEVRDETGVEDGE